MKYSLLINDWNDHFKIIKIWKDVLKSRVGCASVFHRTQPLGVMMRHMTELMRL